MHNGRVSRGWSVAVAVGVSDRWQVTSDTQNVTREIWHMTCDMWHMTFFVFLSVHVCLFWYWCFYLHVSRDLVSPVCRICQLVSHLKDQNKQVCNGLPRRQMFALSRYLDAMGWQWVYAMPALINHKKKESYYINFQYRDNMIQRGLKKALQILGTIDRIMQHVC